MKSTSFYQINFDINMLFKGTQSNAGWKSPVHHIEGYEWDVFVTCTIFLCYTSIFEISHIICAWIPLVFICLIWTSHPEWSLVTDSMLRGHNKDIFVTSQALKLEICYIISHFSPPNWDNINIKIQRHKFLEREIYTEGVLSL